MKSETTPGCCNNAIGTESLPASQDCQSPAILVWGYRDLTVKGNTGIANWIFQQVADDSVSSISNGKPFRSSLQAVFGSH